MEAETGRPSALRHATGTLPLDRCHLVGILNRTPDSFYDGGRMGLSESVERGLRMAAEGADVLDLGAVKAGPGPGVSEPEEIDRLLPLVEGLAKASGALLSVETGRPAVAALALAQGASIVNDVSGLADAELASVCAETGAALVLMHHGGQLRGRPRHPRYDDVVAEVIATWARLAELAGRRGVSSEQLIVDPGLDFGKTTYHSLELLRRLPEQVAAPWPLLVAPSRKDVVGETLGLAPGERLEGTLALVALSVFQGASFVRVHDVAAAARTVAMIEAVTGRRGPRRAVRGLWE